MKNICIILSALLFFTACKKASFLDNKSNNALTEQTVFTDSVRTMSFLTRIYEDEGFAFIKTRWENGGQEQSTDDSEYNLLNTARRPLILYTSSYSADSFPFFTEIWQTPFDNIRRVNLLLSKLPVTPLNIATQRRVAAEARFLRAWYYYNLMINFGGVPIIKDQIFTVDDVVNIPRSTFEESVNYVVKELDEVSALLPATYSGNDYGRVTKGAALAVKAKLLLFAASPLFNGNTFPQPSSADRAAAAGYPAFSVTRWQAAADAAQVIINSGTYSLNVDNSTPGLGFYSLFLKRINNEFIFYYNRVPNRDWEQFYLPVSRGNGSRNGTPTQTLVDAFPTNDGKAITDPTSGYNPQNPYVNRDPRFNYSIIYNGALYYSKSANAKTAVFTYVGAPTDGFTQSTVAAGPSGYFARKMLDENLSADGPGNTDRGWGLIRYAEILLIYAEAINEVGQTAQAYAPLKLIRDRAGIKPGADNNYGMKAGMSQQEMRQFIRNERHIELMYENTRWDDARRWKIATTVFNGYNKLMKPTKVAITPANPTGYNYEVVNSLFLHTFNEKNYLLPIPTSEIRKAPAMVQNPGW